MKQLIRWQGMIAFIVITGAAAAFWLLLADTLVRMSVESVGSELVGAEVNLDTADLSLAPLEVRLSHLQVTDPEQPNKNMLELGEAVASIEPWKLMMGQLIIKDLSVKGLQLNTTRSRPGKVKQKPEEADGKGSAGQQSATASQLEKAKAALPSVSTILGQEELLVTSRAQAMPGVYAEEQAKIDTLLSRIPDDKSRQQYQQRFDRITAKEPKNLQEFNQQKQELEQLQKELKEVKQNLEQTRKQIADSKQRLQQQLAALKAAPGEDLKRLREKYSLSPQGGLNLSRMLFGHQATEWAAMALKWYRKVEPFLASEEKPEEQAPQRARGRYIRFPSSDPSPDFLLRRAQLQASLPFGDVDGVLADVTHQPSIIGRPATLKVAASQLSGVEQFSLNAIFDHVSPEQAKDQVEFSLQALKLDQIQLGEGETAVTLAKAVSDLVGDVTLQHGEIEAKLEGKFRNAQFESSVTEGMAGEIAKTLASIDQFNIEGGASGKLAAPAISLSSDLDKRMSEKFTQRLNAKQAAFEKELKEKLQQRIAGPQAEHQGKLQQIEKYQQGIDEQLAENKKMLQAKLDSYKDNASKQLGDKLKGLKF